MVTVLSYEVMDRGAVCVLLLTQPWSPRLKSSLGDTEKSFLAQCGTQTEVAKVRNKKPREEWAKGRFKAEGSFQR